MDNNIVNVFKSFLMLFYADNNATPYENATGNAFKSFLMLCYADYNATLYKHYYWECL